jgi:hypothetical protein
METTSMLTPTLKKRRRRALGKIAVVSMELPDPVRLLPHRGHLPFPRVPSTMRHRSHGSPVVASTAALSGCGRWILAQQPGATEEPRPSGMQTTSFRSSTSRARTSREPQQDPGRPRRHGARAGCCGGCVPPRCRGAHAVTLVQGRTHTSEAVHGT